MIIKYLWCLIKDVYYTDKFLKYKIFPLIKGGKGVVLLVITEVNITEQVLFLITL